jgi:hypothetical protein
LVLVKAEAVDEFADGGDAEAGIGGGLGDGEPVAWFGRCGEPGFECFDAGGERLELFGGRDVHAHLWPVDS